MPLPCSSRRPLSQSSYCGSGRRRSRCINRCSRRAPRSTASRTTSTSSATRSFRAPSGRRCSTRSSSIRSRSPSRVALALLMNAKLPDRGLLAHARPAAGRHPAERVGRRLGRGLPAGRSAQLAVRCLRHRAAALSHLARPGAGLDHRHRELGRHRLLDDLRARRPAGHPAKRSTRPRASTAPIAGRASATSRCRSCAAR